MCNIQWRFWLSFKMFINCCQVSFWNQQKNWDLKKVDGQSQKRCLTIPPKKLPENRKKNAQKFSVLLIVRHVFLDLSEISQKHAWKLAEQKIKDQLNDYWASFFEIVTHIFGIFRHLFWDGQETFLGSHNYFEDTRRRKNR